MLKSSWKNKPASKTRIGAATIEFKLDDEDFGADFATSGTDAAGAEAGENPADLDLELQNADLYVVPAEADYLTDNADADAELALEADESDLYGEFSGAEAAELDGIDLRNIAVYDNEYELEPATEEAELYDETGEIDELGLAGQEMVSLEPYDDESPTAGLYMDSQAYSADDEGGLAEDPDSRYYEDEAFTVADDDAEYTATDEVLEYADDDDDYVISAENILSLENQRPRIPAGKEFASAAVAPVKVVDYHEDDELDVFDFGSEFDFDFDSKFDLEDYNANFDITDNPIAEIEKPANNFEDEFTAKTGSIADDAYILPDEPPLPAAKAVAAAKRKPIAAEAPPIEMEDDAATFESGLGAAELEEALAVDIVLDGLDFAADAPIEMAAYEDDGADFGAAEDSMELEEAKVLEDINMLADNAMLADVEVLAEALEGAKPLPLTDISLTDEDMLEARAVESLPLTDNALAAEAPLEVREAEPLPDINVSVDETVPETAQDPLSEIQRQAEINQQRIAEMLSHTTKVTATSLSLPRSVQNRRQHNRVPAFILVNYVSSDNDGDSSQGMGVVLDISISGLQLHTPRELAGRHVKLYATDFNDNIMEITGVICQTHQDNSVYFNGISFDSSENDTIKFITNLVRIFNARKYTKLGE